MRRRYRHRPHHESPREARLREVVDELVPDKGCRPAYLQFSRELALSLRRPRQSDFSRQTKRIKATLDEMRPTMLANVTASFTSLALMETQVKQTCDAAGVPTITYPFYLCFGRELWSLCRREFSGESLAQEAAVLVAKWVARGLTQSVLQAIRSDVFNVPAPVAP